MSEYEHLCYQVRYSSITKTTLYCRLCSEGCDEVPSRRFLLLAYGYQYDTAVVRDYKSAYSTDMVYVQ